MESVYKDIKIKSAVKLYIPKNGNSTEEDSKSML